METYLSIEGLAKYLGIAERTVRKWVLNGDIPFHKIMKCIRFRLSEIEQWISTSGKFPIANDEEMLGGDLFQDGIADGEEKGIDASGAGSFKE